MGGGSRKGGEEPAGSGEGGAASLSLGDVLLFATMCIVGLPVEVQVKDGSVYWGVFHTARVDMDYGIVLKKARKIRKGKCDANLEIGTLIDTLVVLSSDLVQVVAKGVLLPAEGIVGNAAGDGAEAVTGSMQSFACDGELERQQRALESDNAASMRSLDEHEENTSCLNKSYNNAEANRGIDKRKLLAKPLKSINEVANGKVDSLCLKKEHR